MKAFVLRSFGSPDALELTDLDTPVPGDTEVLVRVRATSVQPYDWHHMRGEPRVARLMGGGVGLRRPSIPVLGADIAGEVEAVGKDVTEFRPGDEVFAMSMRGGFAEYATVQESKLAAKPESLSFEEAAAIPMAAITALMAVRDQGQVQPGQQVLVNGASGGVGTFAVQLAKAFGAEVTGVCGPRNTGLVRSIGADHVIDYTKEDFTRQKRRYDVVLDIAGNHPGRAYRRVLARKGTCVVVGGRASRWLEPAGHAFATIAMGAFVSQRMRLTEVGSCKESKQNLITLSELAEEGKVIPVIDRSFPFEQIPAAVRYQEEGHSRGKVVVTI
ncbi:NAD(P)-dependent alcohol dehydrogenase [Nonomuraea sp. B12E4]|uniref:NAD(P)-dependent alcohol dehydrogenase n=1 Tax=Nonomuraea sp. B12E4 TaxID=3153564 RepID=UPI00325EDABD